MIFRHPVITQGRIVHPVFGELKIVDGQVECARDVGAALGLIPAPAASIASAPPDESVVLATNGAPTVGPESGRKPRRR